MREEPEPATPPGQGYINRVSPKRIAVADKQCRGTYLGSSIDKDGVVSLTSTLSRTRLFHLPLLYLQHQICALCLPIFVLREA